jgi:hypothetical protein
MSPFKRTSIVWHTQIPVFIIGLASGIITLSYFDGVWNYLFYIIAALIGYLSERQKNALMNALLLGIGYFASMSLVILREESHSIPSITFAIFPVIIGTLLGWVFTYIGYSLRVIIRRRRW